MTPTTQDPDIFASDKTADFRAIVHYALGRDLTIHPVKPRGKEPWLKNWPKQATRNLQTIVEWFPRFPTSNYGVVADDEFCILESDDFESLSTRLSRPLPATYTVAARDNRPHLYFRQTDASKAAGNLDSPGIFEFKQNNRYVVGEGSVHPSGATYVCTDASPIADIPDWLVADLITLRAGRACKVSAPIPAAGEVYGEGEGRHPMLMRTAAQLWDGAHTEEQMVEALDAVNIQHCIPPRSRAHLLDMVRWVMQRSPNVHPKATFSEPRDRRSGTAFDFVLSAQEGQTEGAFALGEVHLLQGSSGAGKTTFGIQLLQAQGRGQNFFGRQTYNRQFLVVMQDRSRFSLERTFRRMGIDKDSFPYVALTSAQSIAAPADVLDEIYRKAAIKPEILFIEGLDMWFPDAVKMNVVVPILSRIQELARDYHIAVIGTVGAPKQKPKERYASPRDRAFGSSAWARRVDTVLDITVDEETQEREVWMLLRNAPPQKYEMRFEDGLLVLKEPSITVGPAPEETTAQAAARLGVSVKTVQRKKKAGLL